ncbi:MAG: metallophosphoesterase [Nonlabens sp.]
MIIQYASDIHIEHVSNRLFLSENPLRPVAEVLVLAGDIMPLREMDDHKDFVQFLADHWKTVVWVPGNHEFYGMEIEKSKINGVEKIKPNVLLCNCAVVEIDDISIVTATLWGKISHVNKFLMEKSLNDFEKISYNGKPLTVNKFNALHTADKDFLKSSLTEISNNKRKVIAVTHHVPTLKNYPSKYNDNPLNEAFVSNFESTVNDVLPSYWIYGHHHENVQNFLVNDCYFLTNQLGYVEADEHLRFKPSLTFNV